ncbi:hypothetical protein SUSAZ_08275 [Sulfolobus acidocaldarius SUSAZ]|nr:hypothetical protein SUSAZ_08275 [Sulfolobus acidocaldarius SUSAZ]
MIKYTRGLEEEKLLREIIQVLGLEYINAERVRVVYSVNSRSRAIARIWSVPKVILTSFQLEPLYVIELITERYSRLSEEEKIKVLIHEILHIPKGFSGGLRAHGKHVNKREVEKLYREYYSKKKGNWKSR